MKLLVKAKVPRTKLGSAPTLTLCQGGNLDEAYNESGVMRALRKVAMKWSDFISGEYWLFKDGHTISCDINYGAKGHHEVALEYILKDKMNEINKALDDFIKQNPKEQNPVVPGRFSNIVGRRVGLPDEVGSQIFGSKDWENYFSSGVECSEFFIKRYPVCHIVGTGFEVWKLDALWLRIMKDFLIKTSSAERGLENLIYNPDLGDTVRVFVTETSTLKHMDMRLRDFIDVKQPGHVLR